jgi:hypothetical protein
MYKGLEWRFGRSYAHSLIFRVVGIDQLSGMLWMGWDGMVWYGMGWDGMGWDGMVWYGMVWQERPVREIILY